MLTNVEGFANRKQSLSSDLNERFAMCAREALGDVLVGRDRATAALEKVLLGLRQVIDLFGLRRDIRSASHRGGGVR